MPKFATEMVEPVNVGGYSSIRPEGTAKLKSRSEKAADVLMYGLPSVGAGMVDTFGTSLGLLDDGDVEEYLGTLFEGGFGDFYQNNKSAARTVGDLTGMFLPGMAATKAVQSLSRIPQIAKNTGKLRYMNSILQSAKKAEQAKQAALRATRLDASKGATNFLANEQLQRYQRLAKNFKTADTIKDTVAFELGVLATMNSSDTLYPDEFSTIDHLLLNSVAPGVFTVVERAGLNKLFRGYVLSESKRAFAVRNPANLPTDQVVQNPETRDLVLLHDSLAATAAREVRDNAQDPTIRSRFNTDVQVFESRMVDTVNKLGSDVPLRDITKRTKLSNGQVKNILEAERTSPGTSVGVMSFDNVPATRDEILDLYTKRDKKLKKLDEEIQQAEGTSKEAELVGQRDRLKTAEFYVLDKDNVLLSANERRPLFTDDPTHGKLIGQKRKSAALNDFSYRDVKTADDKQIARFSENGALFLGTRTADSLSVYESSAVYRLVQETIDKIELGNLPRNIPIGNKNNSHITMDYLLGLHQRFGDDLWNHVNLPPNLQSVDDIAFASLAGKFKAYNKIRDRVQNSKRSKLALSDSAEITSVDIARKLNLPLNADGTSSPILEFFESLANQGDDDFYRAVGNFADSASMENVRRAVQELESFPQPKGFDPNDKRNFMGGMLTLDHTRDPVMVTKKPVDLDFGQKEYLQDGFAVARQMLFGQLGRADKEGGDLVKHIFDDLTAGPSSGPFNMALKVENLAEGSRRGSGYVLSQQYAVGENPTLQAVRTLEEMSDRSFKKRLEQIYREHQDTFIAVRQDVGDLENFNLYVNMRRQGWDIAEDGIEEIAQGKKGLLLEATKANQERFQKLFNRAMDENGEFAPMPGTKVIGKTADGKPVYEYQPMPLTEKALQAAASVDAIDAKYLANSNALRKAKGLSPIQRKPWHVPPKDFSRRPTVAVLNKTGNVHTVVDGRTIQDAKNKAQQIVDTDPGNLFQQDMKDLANYFQIRDEAFEKMMDFSDVLVQRGAAKGTSVSTNVIESGPGVLDDIISSQQRHFESLLRRTRGLMFEPQLAFARQMQQRTGDFKTIQTGQSTYQQYAAAIMGNQQLSRTDPIGGMYFQVESTYDHILNNLWDKVSKGGQTSVAQAEKIKGGLDRVLDGYSPYTSVADVIEKTHKVSPPPSMKKHMAMLNRITSLLTLRLFEVGHAVLTLTSLAATMPGVTKALQRMPGEDLDVWKARIGAYGTPLEDVQMGMFNPSRALASAAHWNFTTEGREFWKKAKDAGYFDQAVAEAWATISAPHQNYISSMIEKGIGVASFLSDKSEEMARAITFMSGAHIAKKGLKIQDDNLVMAFAHRYANETIGNYSPNNRPRMFQGAVGMPLGLFMTFTQNYLQRMFSYVENKQTRALAVQLGTQAAVFGGSTVPGFNQFAQFFGSNYDGSVNPVDGLRQRFGDGVADWVLYGSISNLTGTALFQRGDVNIRSIPTLFTPGDTANAAVIKNFYGAISEGIGRYKASGKFTSQDLAEILGAYSTHRFTRGISQLYAGSSIDRQGNPIATDIALDLEGVSRLTGLRPLSEAKKSEAYYRTRVVEVTNRERFASLRRSVRSAVRGGNLTPKKLNEIVANYVRYGGSPTSFARWLKDQHVSALTDRTSKKLQEVLDDPRRMRDILRLMSALGTSPNDPEFVGQ